MLSTQLQAAQSKTGANAMTSRYTAIIAIFTVMLSPAGPLSAAEDTTAKAPPLSTPTLPHRQRAVTSDDFKPLANSNPGAAIERAKQPDPVQAGNKQSGRIDVRSVNEQQHLKIDKKTHQKIPAHTPEWTDRNSSDPGTTGLNSNPGAVHFGDGKSGARPPTSGAINERYRPGNAIQTLTKPSAPNAIDPAIIQRVAQELRFERTDSALLVWRQALSMQTKKGQPPSESTIENAIASILKQAYPQQALQETRDIKELPKTGDQTDVEQLANLNLQEILQKQQQTQQLISNISKQLHDTAKAVIQKIN